MSTCKKVPGSGGCISQQQQKPHKCDDGCTSKQAVNFTHVSLRSQGFDLRRQPGLSAHG